MHIPSKDHGKLLLHLSSHHLGPASHYPLSTIRFISSTDRPYLHHQHVSKQYPPTAWYDASENHLFDGSCFPNRTNGTVNRSPVFLLFSFTNHLHQPTSAINSDVKYNLPSASSFLRCLPHSSPPPLSFSPVRWRFANRRRLWKKYRPGRTTYAPWCIFPANDRTSRIVTSRRRLASSPTAVASPQASSAEALSSCPPCLPIARVSPVPSTGLYSRYERHQSRNIAGPNKLGTSPMVDDVLNGYRSGKWKWGVESRKLGPDSAWVWPSLSADGHLSQRWGFIPLSSPPHCM